MGSLRCFTVFALALGAGCASVPPPAGLAMPAPDEAGAASRLGGYMMARGWTVQLAGDAAVDASRAGERLTLEPLLDPQGVDRILVTRHWLAAAEAGAEALEAFAGELNAELNVGLFAAGEDGLRLETSLYFLEVLDPRLFDAFLAFASDIELAVLQVQGERRLLALVEGGPAGR
jgi:hypothetical protein